MNISKIIELLQEFEYTTEKVVVQLKDGTSLNIKQMYLEDCSDGTYKIKIETE